jgi:hypothetical protein
MNVQELLLTGKFILNSFEKKAMMNRKKKEYLCIKIKFLKKKKKDLQQSKILYGLKKLLNV